MGDARRIRTKFSSVLCGNEQKLAHVGEIERKYKASVESLSIVD